MKTYYITFIIFLIVLPVSAQTIDEEYISVRNELNAMFENLDKAKVTTGRLPKKKKCNVFPSLSFTNSNITDYETPY